jgi:Ser/Thr protein kinase RdoA (MazF antagonist)
MLTVDFQPPFNHPTVYGNPLLLALMQGILGPDFVLGSFGAVIALPGAEAQHVHRDHPPLFETVSAPSPSFAVTVVVPLIDLTAETGSTRIWKGSHQIPGDQKLALSESAVPYPAAGGCYLMDYQLLHGGTPNVSNIVRPILYIIYYRSWFQEAVNYDQQARLTVTPEAYDAVPRSLKFLLVRQREALRANQAIATHCQQRLAQHRFEHLTRDEQAQQLTKLAETVLPQYGFPQAQVQLIGHGDNTVFAVTRPILDAPSPRTLPDRTILRIHRDRYLSPAAIESELRWLDELHRHSPLRVPAPVLTATGDWCPTAQILGMATPRTCTLTGWVAGRSPSRTERTQPLLLRAIGRSLGQLHHHAAHWPPPASFTRPRWDADGLFGSRAGYSDAGDRVWALTPEPYRSQFAAVGDQVTAVMAELGEDPEQFGLIHGDFWLGNVLVQGDDVGLIDFADCGWGYWGYDLARFLNDFAIGAEADAVLGHLLDGYTQVRTFPEAQLPHLPLFLAAQQVTLALWRINRTQDHPSFQATLDDDLAATTDAIQALLINQ